MRSKKNKVKKSNKVKNKSLRRRSYNKSRISKRSRRSKRSKRSKRSRRSKRSKRFGRNTMKGGSKSDQRVDEEAAAGAAAAEAAAKEAAAKEAAAKERMEKMREKFENLADDMRKSDKAGAEDGEGKDKSWEIMNETEQQDATTLGWTGKSWDAGEGSQFLRHWGSMKPTEMDAAINLGFKETDFFVPEGMDSLIENVILLKEKEAELGGEMSRLQIFLPADREKWGDESLSPIEYLEEDINKYKGYINYLRSHFKENGFADVDIDAAVEAAVRIDDENKRAKRKEEEAERKEEEEAERKEEEEAERKAAEEAERKAAEEAERKAAGEAERKEEEAERKAAEEAERKAAEEAERKAAEADRKAEEEAERKAAEADRKAAEADRKATEADRKAAEAKRKAEADALLGTEFYYRSKSTGQNTSAKVIKYEITEKVTGFLISYNVALPDGRFKLRKKWITEGELSHLLQMNRYKNQNLDI